MLAAGTAVVAMAALSFALVTAGAQTSRAPGNVASAAHQSAVSRRRPPGASELAAQLHPVASAPDVALQASLTRRAAALLNGDRRGWLAALADPASAYGARQARLFDRLHKLPLTRWQYSVAGFEPAEASPAAGLRASSSPTWVADVRLAYRMPGDTRDVTRQLAVRVTRGSTPLLVGDVAVASSTTPMRDLWDIADIVVVRGRRSIVVGDARRSSSLPRYAKATDAAVLRVDAVWGTHWRQTVVVIVPNSVGDMAHVLGRSSAAGLNQIAAVTTGEIDRPQGTGAPAPTADRVVLNPLAFDSYRDARNQAIVLTHEMTHVATRAGVLVSPPLWLAEAFADYVGYRGVHATRAEVVGRYFEEVRAGHAPRQLPSPEAFDPTRGSVDDAYIGAWLALDMIDSDYGKAGVVTFYRIAAGLEDAPPGVALTSDAAMARAYARLGTDAAGFQRRWLAYLQRRAG